MEQFLHAARGSVFSFSAAPDFGGIPATGTACAGRNFLVGKIIHHLGDVHHNLLGLTDSGGNFRLKEKLKGSNSLLGLVLNGGFSCSTNDQLACVMIDLRASRNDWSDK